MPMLKDKQQNKIYLEVPIHFNNGTEQRGEDQLSKARRQKIAQDVWREGRLQSPLLPFLIHTHMNLNNIRLRVQQ